MANLCEELYLIAEYASRCGKGFSDIDTVRFEVTTAKRRGCSVVKVNSDQEYLVDTAWCLGNLTRLPDQTTMDQMCLALQASHPDVKLVGPKHAPRD